MKTFLIKSQTIQNLIKSPGIHRKGRVNSQIKQIAMAVISTEI
jgi:hypothetical protein